MTNEVTGKAAWTVWWNNVPEGVHYPEGLDFYRSFTGMTDKSKAYQDARFELLSGPHGPTLVKAWFARRRK